MERPLDNNSSRSSPSFYKFVPESGEGCDFARVPHQICGGALVLPGLGAGPRADSSVKMPGQAVPLGIN